MSGFLQQATLRTGGYSTQNSLTKAFIDLATYDQHEQGMYGGNDAITYFVRKVVKATWFAKGICALSRGSQVTNWGTQQDIDFTISRSGDYLLNSWLRISLPSVSIAQALVVSGGVSYSPRWCRNLAHNLFSDYQMTFNDLQVDIRKSNYFYDFFTAFTVPASKRVGYDNMVGNVNALINPLADALDPDTPGLISLGTLQTYTLNLPLITPFSRDTGVALPTAALPYNEMKFKFTVRPWSDLLIVDATQAVLGGTTVTGGSYTFNASNSLIQLVPDALATKYFGASQPAFSFSPSLNITQQNGQSLSQALNIDCFCEYAIVSNQERVRMGSCPRDILIEQSQEVTGGRFTASSVQTPNEQDIRFSYPVKALMFGIRNTSVGSEWSNYTCAAPLVNLSGGIVSGITFDTYRYAVDPINYVQLKYENDIRFELPADYFSLVSPYYAATSIPETTGYHLWSYTLDLASVDPKGSTNYGKLTNATIVVYPSDSAVAAVNPTAVIAPPGSGGFRYTVAGGVPQAQTFGTAIVAVNHNFVRVTGGALGFPVL